MDDSPKVNYKTIKLLEDNIGENLDDHGCDETFFRWIDKLNFVEIKNSCLAKDNVKRMRWLATDWKKMFPKDISDKRLIQNIQRALKSQQWENKQPN